MRFGHMVLAVSLVWGVILQGLLSGFPFDLGILAFICLNLTVPFAFFYRLQPQTLQMIELKPVKGRELLFAGGLLLLIYPAIQIIGNLTALWIPNPLEQLPIHASVPLFIGFVLIAPLVEELFFRGYLLGVYESKRIRYSGIWISLWFALYHLNIHQGIYTFFFSLILVGLMQSRRNLVLPILLHSGVNALSYFSSYPAAMESYSLIRVLSVSGWSLAFQCLYLGIVSIGLYRLFWGGKSGGQGEGMRSLKWDVSLSVVLILFAWSVISSLL